MLNYSSADVYLWQEGTNVDCEEEFYGEILRLSWMKCGEERARVVLKLPIHTETESEALGTAFWLLGIFQRKRRRSCIWVSINILI